MIQFNFDRQQLKLAGQIADRFRAVQQSLGMESRDKRDIVMDLDATHSNGCPLDLDRLAKADDFNLVHDVGGIAQHLDRDDDSPTSGKLLHCFLPRFHA